MTPLYKIYYNYKGQLRMIQVKDESKNPYSNSIKDRPAHQIIEQAKKQGLINENTTICEVTSGNMGIALASILKDENQVIICMPNFVSKERVQILQKLNAKVILTNSFDEAFEKANEIAKADNVYLPKQFENPLNAQSYIDLCKELEQQTNIFDDVIFGVGTGGTINGIGNYLKNKYHTNVYAIEPLQTLLLSTGKSHGNHKIEGLSDGFIPKLYPQDIIDKIYQVDDNDAICMAQKLYQQLDLPVGISSGANFLGAVKTGKNNIITVFPDNNQKYYSTDLFNNSLHSKIVDEIELLYFEII